MARKARFDALVDEFYEKGKALNTASMLEIDAVIDPADTRHYLSQTLKAMPTPPVRSHRKRSIDAW